MAFSNLDNYMNKEISAKFYRMTVDLTKEQIKSTIDWIIELKCEKCNEDCIVTEIIYIPYESYDDDEVGPMENFYRIIARCKQGCKTQAQAIVFVLDKKTQEVNSSGF